MAQRDRSQGFGFMYVNIAKVLEERKEVSTDSTEPVSTQNVRHANFNKDTQLKPVANPTSKMDGRAEAMSQIKENLDRLQSLHHKLHAMLDELNHVSQHSKRKP